MIVEVMLAYQGRMQAIQRLPMSYRLRQQGIAIRYTVSRKPWHVLELLWTAYLLATVWMCRRLGSVNEHAAVMIASGPSAIPRTVAVILLA